MIDEQDVLNSINSNPNQEFQSLGEPDKNKEKYSMTSEVLAFTWETAKIIIISLAIIIPIRYYLVQPFFVKGASMEPNFHDGDYLLVDEISYRFNEPKRGEIIVFRSPENLSQYFIKRIVGLPDETVEIKNDRVVVYNADFPRGIELKEGYLSEDQETAGSFFVKLESDEYFVLGDNRLQSSDSRRWGNLDRNLITGRAYLRLWPFSKIMKTEQVSYE